MRFGLKKEMFEKIITAYEESIVEPFFNPTIAEYTNYVQNVYGARIQMGLKIFSQDDKKLSNLMAEFIHPVVALENMKEDCQMGFIYIPKEFLNKAQIQQSTPQEVLTNPKLADARTQMLELCYQNLNKLEAYYPNTHKKNLKIIKGFVNIYKQYLEIMKKRGMQVISPKPMVSNITKMKIILKSMLGK